MRYLITTIEFTFLTNWFEPENHFNPNIEMKVYDLVELKFTNDGNVWQKIDVDIL